ncbi:uncharacterized protein [Macrobrachium rosenbergii]|uniref:uncharacterized protein isoform X2 n=1 Tax=Macrobrachium rosenbergii TaxID=79674 RepID=UPI0034D461AA
MKIREIFILTTVLINTKYGLCICYFPGELQGVWATQKSVTTSSRGTRSPIAYQEVTLEADVILQWGMCHAREDNYVILKDNTGGARCFRCIYLNVASPRVVQVWTMGLETCYTSEEAARSTCPPTQAIASKSAREIMLYKVRSAFGEPEVSEVECPLNGRFTFTYRRGHSGASTSYCSQQTSEFSNCPYGIGFNVLYKDCSFPSPLRSGLQCLGSWIGEDGVDYLAVTDTSVKEGDDAPQFKCGMFHEEVGTGRVFLAFSEDSTCTNSLKSPRDGYETYEMMSTPPPPLPPFVSQAACKFPKSLMGHWHHTYVADDTVVFKDYRNFKTYSARCVKDMNDGERYIVYARSHCGDWSYNCLWLKRRSANVLEFMLGLYPRETFDDLLCEVDKFGDMTSWTTQGKSLLEEPTTCPIVGNYVGVLPDASGICAQLYSDCSNPQIMFYTVSDCSNFSAIYEQREYQCLGQWEEEGRIYALTYRRDIRTYECFVGIIRSNGVVFIKEAGTECSRGVQPEVLGMKLHRKGDSCPQPSPTSQANKSPPKEDTRPRTTQPPWLRTTRPWKPITAALTIENQVVSCKVGMECKSAGKEESSPEKFSLFMKRQTDKRRVHQINLRKNKLASENAIMKRLLNSVRLENRKEVGSLKKSFEVMLKRSKRESHEKAPVLKNSESGASSNKDNDFPYSDGGQHENEMHYKGHSLADPKTEHNSEIVHLTTTSDTYAEESLQARDPEIGKRKKENLCESSCQQTNDNEEHMKGLDSTGDANNSQNKDTMTFIPTTDHLKFTTEFANNRRAIASLYPLSENNDSYINFNHSFSSVDMANDTLLNFENHNRSQRVGISLSHLHSPSHWSIDVHEDDSMKYTKSVQYLDPYTPILLNYKPGTTEMGSNTAHLEPKDLESVHSHGEDFVHSQGENFDDSGHNHRDPHELESSYDDHDDQLQNNDHIHKEKHATLHGHRYETDYIHPPIDKLGIREEDASGNVDDTNMHDYTDDPDNENSHAQADSLTNVEGIVPRSGHIHKDDLAHKDAHDDHKDEHAILTGHGQAHEQDHTSDDHHGQYHQTYRAIPFANKSAPISENHTVEHDEITRHIMPQIDEDFPILLQSEDSNGDYPDPNVTKGCNDGGLENLSSIQNTTNIFQVANCSDEWMNFENGTTEIEVETTTEDSDIPKIPISLLEYPTVLPTTVKPSHVTLPPMIWQPFAQPGRPRHRGSGSSGISASSEPLLIGLISFLCIFSNRA